MPASAATGAPCESWRELRGSIKTMSRHISVTLTFGQIGQTAEFQVADQDTLSDMVTFLWWKNDPEIFFVKIIFQ